MHNLGEVAGISRRGALTQTRTIARDQKASLHDHEGNVTFGRLATVIDAFRNVIDYTSVEK